MSAPSPPPSLDTILLTLKTQYGLYVRPSFLRPILAPLLASSRNPATLTLTIRARLLASDITQSLLPHANLCLPPNLPDTPALPYDVVIQIVDIIDITLSRLDELERLEMNARGEKSGGRFEVIRVTGEGEEVTEGVRKGGMVKVLMEDASGKRAWGVEVTDCGLGKVLIGGKVMVRKGCEVARGVVLLGRCEVMGGRVEAMQKSWIEGRAERLKGEVEALKED